MAIEHKNITEVDLHEPKGVSTAAQGKVYVANGTGSGIWTYIARAAEIYITGGATTLALTATAAKYKPGTAWTQGNVLNLTTTGTTGDINLTVAGIYSVEFWTSFNTDAVAAGTLYTFYYSLDGVPSTRSFSAQKLTAGVDRIDAGASGLVSATAGQVLSIWAKSSINSTVTPVEAGLTAHLISNT